MNFVTVFKEGQQGQNMGLSTGLPTLDRAINGIQRKTSIGVCAAPKCGKTTLADFSFVISPYLQMLQLDRLDDVEWIYYSYEIDRVTKEFKYASFFMYLDFKIADFVYEGVTYPMSQDYLMGRLKHQYRNTQGEVIGEEIILLTDDHSKKLKEIYVKRIIPLFGEYDEHGKKIQPGKIDFIEEADNPTGMYKYLKNHAKANGQFLEESYFTTDDSGRTVEKKRIIGFKPRNPKKYTIVLTDHIRKLKRERGFTMKENIDKWLEYTTEIRNLTGYTFINIAHSNRGVANVDKLRYAGNRIFPTADDVKDSGNLAEESTILLTLFNPNDEKYNLTEHFDVDLQTHPNYRSIHVTESRYTECPVHIQTNMYGNINLFTPLIY